MTASVLAIGAGTLNLLGWSLLHFLWQGAILAFLFGAVLTIARNASAKLRYAICCAALALMALCPIVTLVYLLCTTGNTPHEGVFAAQANTGSLVQVSEWQAKSVSLLEHIIGTADSIMPWLLLAWGTGVLLLLARAIFAAIAVRQLKTVAISPAPEDFSTRAKRVGTLLGITSPFRLFLSEIVTAPAVIGWLKPVILFPMASLISLTPEQLEAMLAHELAHIQRHDYLVNAIQVATETLLFYHPAVWWVSKQLRREREHCCDDIAVAVTGSPLVYAKALYLLEEQRGVAPELTLGGNGGQLTMRIKRLLSGKQPNTSSASSSFWIVTTALLFMSIPFIVANTAIGIARAQNPSETDAGHTNSSAHVISENDARLHLLEHAAPQYPAIALAARVSGIVRIEVTIDTNGKVSAAHVVDGPPMLRQAALDSVIHYRFSPFSSGGERQSVTTMLTIPFRLAAAPQADRQTINDEGKPDLFCTYYDHQAVAHAGTCEFQADRTPQYLCRNNDGNNEIQAQTGCEQKIEALQNWERRKFQEKNP